VKTKQKENVNNGKLSRI